MVVLPFFLITSILEPVVFLVYQYKVGPQSNIVLVIYVINPLLQFHPWKDIITDSEPLDFSPDCLNTG